jgi:phage terminase large subunit-like protein
VQDVADLAYSAIIGAIEADEVLKRKLRTVEHKKQVWHRQTHAVLEVMTFDPAVMTGQKIAGGLIDELHVIAKMPHAAKAIRQLRGGMLPFPEAFLLFITTQSDDIPAGVFRDELVKARAIRDGTDRDTRMLPVLYEFPVAIQKDPAQWRDPANWHMVTPNVGRSISIPRLEQDFRTAEKTSEAELRSWASQHLNVEIGLALSGKGWVGAKFWEQCAEPVLKLEDLLERSEVVTVGGDGGGLDDLFGIAVVGREVDTGKWLVWTHAWAHPIVLERRKQLASTLQTFAGLGELTIVDSAGDDVVAFADIVEQCEDAGLLDRVGLDPVGIGATVDEIVDRGIAHERVVGIPQGYKLAGAIKTVERKLAAHQIAHGASTLMAWCVGNAIAEPRGNAILITRESAGSAKVDPLLALFNAVALMAMNPKPRKKKFQFFVAG